MQAVLSSSVAATLVVIAVSLVGACFFAVLALTDTILIHTS